MRLIKYSKVQSATGKKITDLKQAAGILVQLLEANNLVPIKYRRRMIMEILPLVKENALNEEQIYSVLRSIQNYENRIEVFNETGKKNFNRKINEQIRILDVENNYPVYQKSEGEFEYNYNLDGAKFNELLAELSVKLSDCLSLKSVEIEN